MSRTSGDEGPPDDSALSREGERQQADTWGFLSSVLGSLAIGLAMPIRQFELLRHPHSGYALGVAQRLGILKEPDGWSTPEISDTTVLTITDAWFIAAVENFAGYLAVLAIGYALWAEYRDEDSLYLAVGFLCAGMALFLLHPIVGVAAGVFGSASILVMRRRSTAEAINPPSPRQLKSPHD